MFIDGLQYCNWSKKIFEDWRSANLTAVHVTISYHEQFRETVSNFEKWNLYFENFSNLAKEKFVNSYDFTIPWGEKDKAYGIVFDVPAAFFEIIFNIEEPIKYYQLRHLLTFIYFFIGLVFFYKIILNVTFIFKNVQYIFSKI